MLVKAAARFQSDFYIRKDAFEINGKSIIGVMTLAAEQGATLILQVRRSGRGRGRRGGHRLFERGFDEE